MIVFADTCPGYNKLISDIVHFIIKLKLNYKVANTTKYHKNEYLVTAKEHLT